MMQSLSANFAKLYLHDLNPDEAGDTILHSFIICDKEEDALNIIDAYPHLVQIQNNLYQTPLHLAVLMQHHRVVSQLLTKSVDVNMMDHNGNTPLHLACLYELYSMVDLLLLSRGNDWNVRNYDGYTCLQLAVECDNAGIVELLLSSDETGILFGHGKSGRSAVHFAVDNGNEKILALLLARCTEDLNVYHRDFAGNTPMDLACGRNNTTIQKMLVKYDEDLSLSHLMRPVTP
ncbi:hypothetical protein EGW08_022615 [Elysia chlorotica]|uniref:Uncharacterized protein n=1 Tax=Elysia chlorotica TaxID=188477 RepID=A0A3S0Z939_ELYCH|nr:hypothetical protein EGW08_022615 [Elysia chlorotica]